MWAGRVCGDGYDGGNVPGEAHPGLGEAVVSGSATPDRYVLDRKSGALRGGPATGCLDEPSLRAQFGLNAPAGTAAAPN